VRVAEVLTMRDDDAAHRRRLLAGMAAAVAERPYPQVTVADIVRLARTSRRTFYEHFADKQECLVALIEDSHRRLVTEIAGAVDRTAAWTDQVRQAIEAWIAGVQADPRATLNWIRIVPSLGPDAHALMRGTLGAYAELIRSLAGNPAFAQAGVRVPSRQETTMLLGALRELIATTVEDGDDITSIIEVATDFTIRVLSPWP
jgi:AcrR family transcriptional regulator